MEKGSRIQRQKRLWLATSAMKKQNAPSGDEESCNERAHLARQKAESNPNVHPSEDQ